jgi:hypothetical protein
MTCTGLLAACNCTCADTIDREVKATFNSALRILNLQPGFRITIRNDGWFTAFRKETGF